jgi:hypothetical protein
MGHAPTPESDGHAARRGRAHPDERHQHQRQGLGIPVDGIEDATRRPRSLSWSCSDMPTPTSPRSMSSGKRNRPDRRWLKGDGDRVADGQSRRASPCSTDGAERRFIAIDTLAYINHDRLVNAHPLSGQLQPPDKRRHLAHRLDTMWAVGGLSTLNIRAGGAVSRLALRRMDCSGNGVPDVANLTSQVVSTYNPAPQTIAGREPE